MTFIDEQSTLQAFIDAVDDEMGNTFAMFPTAKWNTEIVSKARAENRTPRETALLIGKQEGQRPYRPRDGRGA